VNLLLEANPKVRKRNQQQVLLGEELTIPAAEVVQRVLKGEKPAVALAGPQTPAPARDVKLAAGGARPNPPKATKKSDALAAQVTTLPPSAPTAGKPGTKAQAGSKARNRRRRRPCRRRRKARGRPRQPRRAREVDGGRQRVDGPQDRQARGQRPAGEVRAGAGERRDATNVGASLVHVQKNDSLQAIAKRCLNDERRWREIAELNGLKKPNQINSGARLKIPPVIATAHR